MIDKCLSNKKTRIKESVSDLNTLIACIDDSITMQYIVKASLEKSGYQVLNIIKPTQQLLEIFEKKPRLILMDINMPDISGYQLCQILKSSQITKDIPIVMMTSQKSMISRVRSKLNGSSNYITKPFTSEGLINRVKSLVEVDNMYEWCSQLSFRYW